MKISIPKEVVYRDLAGEAVILNLASGIYFGLNETATRIWHLLESHNDEDDLLEALTLEYSASREQLRRDLEVFVKQLAEKGLIAING
jgi:hypothetical protein